jgi:Polyketide cyclase / dehydrase and lipid transport
MSGTTIASPVGLLSTPSHSAWGGAVTAQMYLPMTRSQVWLQLIDYPRWVQYFPDMVRSEILLRSDSPNRSYKRIYQVASKAFLMFSAQVEVYLKVFETVLDARQHIQFRLERGHFSDFAADLNLQDHETGTVLTYSVQATPTIPVPTQLIQQAIRMDLPDNLRKMRQVLCA